MSLFFQLGNELQDLSSLLELKMLVELLQKKDAHGVGVNSWTKKVALTVNKRKANWSSFYTLEMLSICVLDNLIKIENYSNTNFSKLK